MPSKASRAGLDVAADGWPLRGDLIYFGDKSLRSDSFRSLTEFEGDYEPRDFEGERFLLRLDLRDRAFSFSLRRLA